MIRLGSRLPRFVTSLYFRIAAIFLLLLGLSAGGYYLLINATVFDLDTSADADTWFADLAADELDTLADRITGELGDDHGLELMLVEFGERVDAYDAEVAVIGRSGRALATSDPDSLTAAIGSISIDLLESMTADGWDWESYPIPDDIDAYGNRIFEVDPLWADADSTRAADAYLVASFRPYVVSVEELETGTRGLGINAIAFILICAAASGLLIMGWLSRRIRLLSAGVNEFSQGNLAHRIPARSTDELDRLAGQINSMATRLETSIEDLRQKERFQRQLVANISHDLRTPLATLAGYVETLALKHDELPATDRQRYYEIVTASVEHLETLVEHLLVLSRLDSGQAEFRPETFLLPELVDEVMGRCNGLADKQQVELSSTAAQDLPLVHADPLQIGQALQNLIENGIKFNSAGGSVVVEIRSDDAVVAVTVRDTGHGIEPADLPHVRERFFTADKSRSRKGESSGLGLAICDRILEAHGSPLEIESAVGVGTTVRFILPAEQDRLELEAEA